MSNEQIVYVQHPAEHFKYNKQIEAAKRWLGDRYLLAKPVNAHHNAPAFLRPQI